MYSGLRRRIREAERRSGADGSFVLMPLPGQPDEYVRIPRPFAEFLAQKEQEHRAAGGYYDLTDGRWMEY
jgi:hypothetical protein